MGPVTIVTFHQQIIKKLDPDLRETQMTPADLSVVLATGRD